jgi:predicted MFS family arabinose efflux permease
MSDLRTGSVPGRLQQVSTRIVFFIAGFGVAAWAPLVPYARARTGIDADTLGLLLLCLGLGSMVTMPLAGALTARFGCRRVLAASSVLLCITLPFLATLSSVVLLVPALFAFGAAVGAIDVAANIQAIIVERAGGRPMMSGFHGLFSLGGIAGAAGATALLSAGLSPLAATIVAVAVIAVALALAVSHLLPYGSQREGPAFALPRGVVLFIGSLCFVVFLAEGAVLDWSAVFLTSVRGMDAAQAGLGYAVFASAMTIGRLAGDGIVARFGNRRIVIFGGLCAAAGFAVTAAPWREVALLGFLLVGVGCANIVPVLFTAVGRQTTMPESVAVPAITTLGYAGILVGPAAIGVVAQAIGLTAAFLLLAALLLGVGASGRFLQARANRRP